MLRRPGENRQDQPERPYLSLSQVFTANNGGTGIAVAVTEEISLLQDPLQSKGSEASSSQHSGRNGSMRRNHGSRWLQLHHCCLALCSVSSPHQFPATVSSTHLRPRCCSPSSAPAASDPTSLQTLLFFLSLITDSSHLPMTLAYTSSLGIFRQWFSPFAAFQNHQQGQMAESLPHSPSSLSEPGIGPENLRF